MCQFARDQILYVNSGAWRPDTICEFKSLTFERDRDDGSRKEVP